MATVESQQEQPDQQSQPEPEPEPEPEPTIDQEHLAVDEDQTTIQEEDRSQNEQQQQQQEQDETLKDQQKQKEAEEENAAEASNDAAAVVEVNGSGEANNEVEKEEELIFLLNPFTKEQLVGIVKQVLKKSSNIARMLCEIFRVKLEEGEDLDLPDELVKKYLETINYHYPRLFLMDMGRAPHNNVLVSKVAGQLADVNPPHLKILVKSHGFRWAATCETLSSIFRKCGEIREIEVCKNITDKIQGYAFISFKHWSGAHKALKHPLKKIGNRWAVCQLASSACEYELSWLESADNSVESAKNALEELHKVVDGPKGNKGYQQQQNHHQPTGPAVGGCDLIGNRSAVCELASSAYEHELSWLESADNSVESPKNALEELHKVVDGPKGNKGYQQQQNHHQPTGPAVGGCDLIGNRWAVCELASSAYEHELSWLESADNSVECPKNALEEPDKVVDRPKGNKGYQQHQNHHQPTGPAVGGCDLILSEYSLNLVPEKHVRPWQRQELQCYRESHLQNLLQWLHSEPVNRARLPIHVTYCNQAAMNLSSNGTGWWC